MLVHDNLFLIHAFFYGRTSLCYNGQYKRRFGVWRMELKEIRESHTISLGKEIAYYEEVDSTNTKLKEWAKLGAKEGSLVIAERQSKGRGRQGKVWESPKAEGIWMSILLCPKISLEKIAQFTLLAGLATCEGIRKATDMEAQIKWPNDLVINGKKISGILCETVQLQEGYGMIIGIGINVNSQQFPSDLPHASSLYLEGNQVYKREIIIKSVLEHLEEYYILYKQTMSLANIMDLYKLRCINLGKKVKVLNKQKELIGTVKDINLEGQLIIETLEGKIETIFAGEVSVRGLYGYI